jgi:periplasmic protein TonB
MKNRFVYNMYTSKSLLTLPFLFIALSFSSCNFSSDKSAPGAEIYANDSIYHIVEMNPEYAGGQTEMRNFLQSNLLYPEKALEEGAEGTVFMTFVVEPNGEVTNVSVVRGVTEDLDQEAIRVVRQMPRWKPGSHEGSPVRVRLHLPVRFVLEPIEE